MPLQSYIVNKKAGRVETDQTSELALHKEPAYSTHKEKSCSRKA